MATVAKRRFHLFSSNIDKPLLLSMLVLYIFGSFMIISAEMGNNAGSTAIIISTAIKQILFFILGLIGFVFTSRLNLLSIRRELYEIVYWIMLVLLLIPRLFFRASNGAYGWIYIFGFSFQPSELAKVFIILYGARLLGRDMGKKNYENLVTFAKKAFYYFLIILFIQHDLGSAAVLFLIAYCIALIPPYPQLSKIQGIMRKLVIFAIPLILLVLSPIGTSFLKKLSGDYRIARFLSSANPFEYIYDDGYHLVMSLISIATGGWFGLGYGNSIHKYMNFPNPSNDFILPVIIEEMGIVFGLLPVVILYIIMLVTLFRYGLKVKYASHKMVLLGSFMYLVVHFILNVGGVSGLIPLTGVPLLLVSSGGTSAIATFLAIGLSEYVISSYKKETDI